MKPLRAALTAAIGAAAYSLVEPRWHRLQTHRLTVREGLPPLDILHISDAHVRESDRSRLAFLASLATRPRPDMILATGDLIEDDTGIDPLLDALEGLEAPLGKFYVLGSHDYYQSTFKIPFKYLLSSEPQIDRLPPADTMRLEKGLASQGWVGLLNTTQFVDSGFGRIRVAGVDDPHLHRHRTEHIDRTSEDALAIALVHSPDVVSQWALNDFDLVVAGHTHGGQLRAPFLGSLVTNCSLPNALSAGPNLIGNTWLHVSPGLGVSTLPVRFLCRPEVTVLELRQEDR